MTHLCRFDYEAAPAISAMAAAAPLLPVARMTNYRLLVCGWHADKPRRLAICGPTAS